jgi:hypothetical protein
LVVYDLKSKERKSGIVVVVDTGKMNDLVYSWQYPLSCVLLSVLLIKEIENSSQNFPTQQGIM